MKEQKTLYYMNQAKRLQEQLEKTKKENRTLSELNGHLKKQIEAQTDYIRKVESCYQQIEQEYAEAIVALREAQDGYSALRNDLKALYKDIGNL